MAMDHAIFMQKLRKERADFMVNRKLAVGFSTCCSPAPRDDPMSRALSYFVNRELSRAWLECMARRLVELALARIVEAGWLTCFTAALRGSRSAWIEMAVMRAEFLQLAA